MEHKKGDWEALVRLFASVKTEDEMDQLLSLFLTLNEKEFLRDRYGIVKQILTSSRPQREIAKKLGVSIAKITAGSNELKKTSDDLKQVLQIHFQGE